MKKIIIGFLLISSMVYSQEKQPILETAAKETCEYLNSLDLTKISKQERSLMMKE